MTHINIRQSISVLLAKLIFLEIIFLATAIVVCFPLACVNLLSNPIEGILSVQNILFIVIMLFKLLLVLIVIGQWLDEYYEIWPDKLSYRRGVFFKKEEEYIYSHIMSVDMYQGFFGEIMNYGTIHMYDRYINKDVYLYLVHNPKRYFNILKDLIPIADSRKQVIREKIVEEEL